MTKTQRVHYEGDPSLVKVMVQPRWLAALVLAMVVAAVFAWLGQWQMGHAIATSGSEAPDSEVSRPISEVTGAGELVTDGAAGMVMTLSGGFVPGDFNVVQQRTNGGEIGAWVVGHLAVDGSGGLPAAMGWAPTVEQAERALAAIEQDHVLFLSGLNFEGRYMPSDAAVIPAPDQDPQTLGSMVPAQLVNLWAPFEGLSYGGYIVLHPTGALSEPVLAGYGLNAIDSVAPLPPESVNWLNVFYAIEWVVFAGFAIFFWYRLVRDDWEKIHELKLLTEAEGGHATAVGAGAQRETLS